MKTKEERLRVFDKDNKEELHSSSSNLQFLFMGSPHKHDELTTQINSWKYPVEGRIFKGEQSPYISELRVYDVRYPDSIEKDLINSLHFKNLERIGGVTNGWKYRLLNLIKKCILFFTPFEEVPDAVKKHDKYRLAQWFYSVPIGKIKRKPVKVKTGGKRGVL